jgi:hypothetical protein
MAMSGYFLGSPPAGLKPPISGFQAIQRIQQLQAYFADRITSHSSLLQLLYGKSNPIERYSGLIRHLKLF